MKTPLIAPSLLSADFGNLQRDIEMINQSQADWFHIDVMDGVFVPNISFGFPIMASIQKHAQKPLDVHLMIVNPDNYIQRWADAGADVLTVHLEACNHLHRSLQSIRNAGMKAGVAINPHINPSSLEYVLGDFDVVCVMSVNPGFGGQKFIPSTIKKVEQLNEMRQRSGAHFLIEIDGGVDLKNYKELVNAGADVLVAGNTVFGSENPSQTISQLKVI